MCLVYPESCLLLKEKKEKKIKEKMLNVLLEEFYILTAYQKLNEISTL